MLFARDRRQGPTQPEQGARVQALALAKVRDKCQLSALANPDGLLQVTLPLQVVGGRWRFAVHAAEVVAQFQEEFASVGVAHFRAGHQQVHHPLVISRGRYQASEFRAMPGFFSGLISLSRISC